MKHPFHGFVRGSMIAFLTINLSSQLGAQYFSIDFDTDDSGGSLISGTTDLGSVDPYANLFAAGVGVLLSTDNPSVHPLNLYDSETPGGFDDDLERDSQNTGEWAGGSSISGVYDNLLIINEFTDITIVDDEGTGGELRLDFGIALTSFGFDFVDMDAASGATLILTDTGSGNSASIPFADFEDGSGSVHETTNVLFGNRHANEIRDILASEVGLTQFDRVVFDLTSSGGIGAAYFETVPEPGSLMLLGGLVAGLVRRVRR